MKSTFKGWNVETLKGEIDLQRWNQHSTFQPNPVRSKQQKRRFKAAVWLCGQGDVVLLTQHYEPSSIHEVYSCSTLQSQFFRKPSAPMNAQTGLSCPRVDFHGQYNFFAATSTPSSILHAAHIILKPSIIKVASFWKPLEPVLPLNSNRQQTRAPVAIMADQLIMPSSDFSLQCMYCRLTVRRTLFWPISTVRRYHTCSTNLIFDTRILWVNRLKC